MEESRNLALEETNGTILGEIFAITPAEVEQTKKSLAKFKAGERAVGTMNELEQKIYALIFKKGCQKGKIKGSLDTALNEDLELLRRLMFFIMRRRLGLTRLNVGIRTGFQLVYLTEVNG